MEINSDNVAEIEKYAFLLGSAIKNEDTDQFFSIYDSILPKDIPDNQLEEIKDRARKIVDLPDSEFNSLVLRARHFSLAPAGKAMTCRRESPSKRWTQPGKDEESEDEEGKTRYSYSNRFDTSSLHSTTKISTRSSESDTRRFDDDSGVCNSSKATNSIGSLSDNDGSEDEGRGGSFDYYPPQIKIRSGCGLSLDYDEAHEVKSDHSSQDINSPRSDFSEGIEMTTFNSREPDDDDDDDEFKFRRETVSYQDDFNTSGESEDENSYRHKYYNLGYRPLSRDVPNFQPTFDSLNTSSLRSNDVDRGISFSSLKDGTSQYSRYSSYQYPHSSSSSDRVKIEKNSYKRDKADPPFGRGPEHFGKVASSIDSLISQVPSDEVKNMPEGRKLEPLQREDTKRKKKKKKGAKDDASVGTDENGNPVETRSLTSAQYKQMRESPSAGGVTVANQPSENSYGTFMSSDTLGARSYTRETENESAQKARRRKNKQEKLKIQQKAEDCENYKGDRPLEELINFIGGQNDSNKKAKKNSAIVEDIPSKTQKSNKKNKDKKQKSPTASSSVEEVEEKGGVSAQPTDLDTQGGEDNMGNSSGKADVEIVENGDIDGIYSQTDKLTKSSLKQNDKIDINKPAIYVDNDNSLKGVTCRESVKEKEHSATNNKRDIVTGSGSEINKKKTEKSAKLSKSDKSEMPATKSEEALKVDTNLPNNVTVKQKNAKNKKNKSLSTTQKLDNELSLTDVCNQPVFASFPSGENLDPFIFTDLDVPQVPQEDEFQVVGKKKKKITKDTGHQNHFVTNNGNSKPSRRLDDKRPVLSQSSNKASVPTVAPTAIVESDTRLRDLSPSAFPALTSGKGRQSIQEGRRNSTGDVPIPSGLKSQDDSDLESVKSLPATQGSLAVDSVLSPRLSYAKMAAGPKVPESSSSSEKRSSLDSGDSEHDHKKSVWKGSPTERRHSIGSSPEEMNKVTGSQASVSSASVKAGSQEHIVADVVITLEKCVADSSVTPFGEVDSKAKSLEEGYSVLNKEHASPCEAYRTAKISPVQTKSSISPNKYTDNAVSTSNVGNSQQVVPSMQTGNNKPEMNSTLSVNKNISITNSSVHKQETSKGRTCQNGSNGRKQKSVIFLDKRVEETPENLGISFGFEMESLIKLGKTDQIDLDKIDQSEQIVEKSETTIEKENVPSVNDLSSINSKSEPKDVNAVVLDTVRSTSSSPSVIFNHISKTGKLNSLSSNNDIVDPVKTVVRMNGIIPPQGHSKNLSKEIKETVSVNPVGSGGTVEAEQAIPETEDNRVCVYYGESVVTLKKDVVVPSLNNGPTSYCGLIRFMEEKDMCSNFNLADAAAFLSKEWDKVMQMQDKDPESVRVLQD